MTRHYPRLDCKWQRHARHGEHLSFRKTEEGVNYEDRNEERSISDMLPVW